MRTCFRTLVCAAACAFAAGEGAVAQEEKAAVYSHAPVSEGTGELSAAGEQRVLARVAFLKGVKLQGRGDFSGAEEALESALALDPASITIALKLARTAMLLSEPQHALQVLRDSLMRNAENPQAYLNLAQFCENVADNLEKIAQADESGTTEGEAAMLRVQAEDVLLTAVEKFPEYPSVYWQLLRLYLAQNRKPHAQEMLRKAIARNDSDPYYWLEIGQQAQQAWPLADREHYDEHLAITNQVYERALAAAAGNAEVNDRVADYFSQTRQYDRAVELYQRAITQSPGMLLAREKLARVLGVLGQHDEKLAALTELVRINPYDARIQKFIGGEFQGRADRRKAIDHYLAATKAGENDAVFLHDLIDLMLAEKMVNEALPVVRRAYFLYPDSFAISVQLARVHAEMRDWNGALRAFRAAEKGVDADELDDQFYFEYGTVAQQAGLHAQAEWLFRKSSERVSKNTPERNARVYDALARVWLDQGKRIAEAAELIGIAIDLEPDSSAYLVSLGRCHYLRGDYDKAIEVLSKAEKADEQPSAVTLNQLAMAEFRMGNPERAIALLERALTLGDATDAMRSRLKSYRAGKDPDPPPVSAESEA
ncbi:MAG: tetratricopeptide repeat protein [Verrucomicrobiales bacterium]